MQSDDSSQQTTVTNTTADTPPATPVAATTVQPKNDKKKWIIIASVLVALIAGGTAGAMWWTSPQTSLDGAMTSDFPKGGVVKGTMEVKPSGSPAVTLDFDTKFSGVTTNTAYGLNADLGMMKLKVDGGLATDASKNVYFRVNNVRKTLQSVAGSSAPMVEQQYGGLIDKIDNKWVQMTESDLKDISKDSSADMTCVIEKFGKITQDKKYSDELKKIFTDNKYISIKETVGSEKINGNDTNHIVLAIDKAKMKSYNAAMKNSALMKDIASCFKDKEKAFSEEDSAATGDVKYEVWVDKWSHRINKLVVSGDSDGTAVKLTAEITYNNGQKVDTPKADTQFKDLKTEVEKLQNDMTPALSDEELNAI